MSFTWAADISAVEKHLNYSYLRAQLTAKKQAAELFFSLFCVLKSLLSALVVIVPFLKFCTFLVPFIFFSSYSFQEMLFTPLLNIFILEAHTNTTELHNIWGWKILCNIIMIYFVVSEYCANCFPYLFSKTPVWNLSQKFNSIYKWLYCVSANSSAFCYKIRLGLLSSGYRFLLQESHHA